MHGPHGFWGAVPRTNVVSPARGAALGEACVSPSLESRSACQAGCATARSRGCAPGPAPPPSNAAPASSARGPCLPTSAVTSAPIPAPTTANAPWGAAASCVAIRPLAVEFILIFVCLAKRHAHESHRRCLRPRVRRTHRHPGHRRRQRRRLPMSVWTGGVGPMLGAVQRRCQHLSIAHAHLCGPRHPNPGWRHPVGHGVRWTLSSPAAPVDVTAPDRPPRPTEHLTGGRRRVHFRRSGLAAAVDARVVRRNGTWRRRASLACAMCDGGDVVHSGSGEAFEGDGRRPGLQGLERFSPHLRRSWRR